MQRNIGQQVVMRLPCGSVLLLLMALAVCFPGRTLRAEENGLGTNIVNNLMATNSITVGNALVVNGGFTNKSTTTYAPGAEQALTNGGSVGVTGLTYVRIRGDTGAVTALGSPPIALGAAGQIIVLQGNDRVKTVTFTNSSGLVLEGGVPFTMGSNDVIQLVYDGNMWLEVYRSCK